MVQDHTTSDDIANEEFRYSLGHYRADGWIDDPCQAVDRVVYRRRQKGKVAEKKTR
jgi:hypothetical protein